MSEWFFDHGCGEGFTITVEEPLDPTQIYISCALEGGQSWDSLDITEIFQNNPKIRAAFKDCIDEIEKKKEDNMDKLTDLLSEDYQKEYDLCIYLRSFDQQKRDLIFTAYGVSEFFVVKVLEKYSGAQYEISVQKKREV